MTQVLFVCTGNTCRSALAEAIAVTRHVESFARGVVDARPVVLYTSLTVFLLFTATRMLESHRWR